MKREDKVGITGAVLLILSAVAGKDGMSITVMVLLAAGIWMIFMAAWIEFLGAESEAVEWHERH